MKRRRMTALILLLAILLNGCAPGRVFLFDSKRNALPDAPTRYFSTSWHADVAYENMQYEIPNLDEFKKQIETLEAMSVQDNHEKELVALYYSLEKDLRQYVTYSNLADVKTYCDTTDVQAATDAHQLFILATQADNLLKPALGRLIQSTRYGELFTKILGEDSAQLLRTYTPLTGRQLELATKENELVLRYRAEANKEHSISLKGRTWNYALLEEKADFLDYDTYWNILCSLEAEANKAVGEIYIQLLQVRQEIATLSGYTSYTDYAYEEVYHRNYTPQQANQFENTISKKIGPYFFEKLSRMDIVYKDAGEDAIFTHEEMLGQLNTYLPRISAEMGEALQYMMKNHLYFLADASTPAADAGFTTEFSLYNAPFLYNYTYGYARDFTNFVHEFGHYSNTFYFNEPPNSLWGLDTLDAPEVHSQGLECLFAALYYPQIYGEETGALLETQLLYDFLGSVVQGCVQDEFQQAVYANPNMTLEQINAKYLEIRKGYGAVSAPDEYVAYEWSRVPHNFESPLYYISYATSALTALTIWINAKQSPERGVNQYLRFCSYSTYEYSFLEILKLCKMDNFTNESYVNRVCEAVENSIARSNYTLPQKEAA